MREALLSRYHPVLIGSVQPDTKTEPLQDVELGSVSQHKSSHWKHLTVPGLCFFLTFTPWASSYLTMTISLTYLSSKTSSSPSSPPSANSSPWSGTSSATFPWAALVFSTWVASVRTVCLLGCLAKHCLVENWILRGFGSVILDVLAWVDQQLPSLIHVDKHFHFRAEQVITYTNFIQIKVPNAWDTVANHRVLLLPARHHNPNIPLNNLNTIHFSLKNPTLTTRPNLIPPLQ